MSDVETVTLSVNGKDGVTVTGEQFSKLPDLIAKEQKRLKVLQIPEELMDSKAYKTLKKQMGDENCREFFQKSEEELRATIAECRIQTEEAKRQTEANVNYQQSDRVLKDFKSALRDATTPLTNKASAAAAIIAHRNEAKKAAKKG